MLAQKRHAGIELLLRNTGGTAQNNAVCVLNLIVIELAEILHVHLALVCIGYGCEAVQHNIVHVEIFNRTDNIAQLADTGRLDKDSVRVELLQNLLQCFAEVADKATADAAGIHFGDLNTGILQKAAVNCDLTELIFNQNKLFALKSFCDQLFDQCSFTGTEKSGENIDLCHIYENPFVN